MGVLHTLLKVVEELNRREIEVADTAKLVYDSLCCLETVENTWNGYPANVDDPWGRGRWVEEEILILGKRKIVG